MPMDDPPPTTFNYSPPEAPRFSARFRQEHLLGMGALGKVWKARDLLLDEWVALKVLHAHLKGDDSARNSLQREVQGLRRLYHPNIVRVFDVHEDAGAFAVAMEWIDGPSLATHLASLPEQVMDPAALIQLIEPIAHALDHAHECGVLHRDLKPANILISQDGTPKLADFGLAIPRVPPSDSVTEPTPICGTLPYLSPQILSGEQPGAADDCYALAVTAFECITGKPPFHSAAIDLQIRAKPAPTVTRARSQHAPGAALIPADWDQVFGAALAKDPAQRPATAGEFVSRLRASLTPIANRQMGALGRPSSGNLIVLSVATAVLAILMLTLLRNPSENRQPEPGLPIPEMARAVPDGPTPEPAAPDTPTPTGLAGYSKAYLAGHLPLDGDLACWPDRRVIPTGPIMAIADRDHHPHGALSFPGRSMAEVPDPWSGQPLPSEFGVSFWYQTNHNDATLFSFEQPNALRPSLRVGIRDGALVYEGEQSAGLPQALGPSLIPGHWHHIAVSVQQGTIRAHLNGMAYAKLSFPGEITASSWVRLFIAGSPSLGSGIEAGAMDDFRWYRRSITGNFAASLAAEPALRPGLLFEAGHTAAQYLQQHQPLPFALSALLHEASASWDGFAVAEYGDGALPADWEELKPLAGSLDPGWLDGIGVRSGDSFLIRRRGSHEFQPGRYYLAMRADGRVPADLLVHDHSHNHTLIIGSASGLKLPLLVRLPSMEHAAWRQNLTPPWPEPWIIQGAYNQPGIAGWQVPRDTAVRLHRSFAKAPARTAIGLRGIVTLSNGEAGSEIRLLIDAPESRKQTLLTLVRPSGSPQRLVLDVHPSTGLPREVAFDGAPWQFSVVVTTGVVVVRGASVADGQHRFEFYWDTPDLAIAHVRRIELALRSDDATPMHIQELEVRGY